MNRRVNYPKVGNFIKIKNKYSVIDTSFDENGCYKLDNVKAPWEIIFRKNIDITIFITLNSSIIAEIQIVFNVFLYVFVVQLEEFFDVNNDDKINSLFEKIKLLCSGQ